MKIEGEQILLRVYLRSTEQYHLAPLYSRLVSDARKRGMAGATVLMGIHGFGHSGELHDSALALKHHAPVIVEIVDAAAKIGGFVRDVLGTHLENGIATLERAHVMFWRQRGTGAQGKLSIGPQVEALSTLPVLERSGTMESTSDGVLLRIFIGDSDHVEATGAKHEPLYKAIVNKARELGLRGATVLRGSMGFGANSVLHTSKVLELSSDLPLVIEIVDERARIEKLLPYLEQVVHEGMVTMEEVRVLVYRGTKTQDNRQKSAGNQNSPGDSD